MGILTLAASLAQFVPAIIKLITGNDSAQENAQKIVNVAKTITGTSEDQIISTITSNQDYLLKFKQQMADLEESLSKTDSDNVAQINQTMRSEIASEHWPTYCWRPVIGFACALNLAIVSLILLVTYTLAICMRHTEPLQYIPAMLGADAALLATMMPILGVASYFRGKMQADSTIPTINRG